MSDSESIKKMLRSVLQSSKDGVAVHRLQSEYRSLCGEGIPLKKLGFTKLEDYLRSIPSVVRLRDYMGELKCFAAVCQETAHIAELVARQKSAKKSGGSQLVNCRMRFKPSNPYMLNMRPKSLRQPSAGSYRPHGGYRGFSAPGDYRKLDQRLSGIIPVEHRQPVLYPPVRQTSIPVRKVSNHQLSRVEPPEKTLRPDQSQYDVRLMQSRMTQLLEKNCSGVWLSKLPGLYRDMFGQELHPRVLSDLEKWTHICMVEETPSSSRSDRLIYPPLPPKPGPAVRSTTNGSPAASPTSPTSGQPSPVPKPRLSPLAKPTFHVQPSSSGKKSSSAMPHQPAPRASLPPRLAARAAMSAGDSNQNAPVSMLSQNRSPQTSAPTLTRTVNASPPPPSPSLIPGPDILPLLKVTLTSAAPCPPQNNPAPSPAVSPDVLQKLKELLSKNSQGLWVTGLPQLFMDTFNVPFPEHVLDDLSLLLDNVEVVYPVPGNKTKAILYSSSRAELETLNGAESRPGRGPFLPSGLKVQSPIVPPSLVLPTEQYPSVLVTEASSSNAVTIRYVGENYSNAQEAMEETMRSFYSQSSNQQPPSDPMVGYLVAVRGEDGEELARAQVMAIIPPNKVKVYFVDYGFSVDTCKTNLLHLHRDFLSLPFQATNVKLAGLEAFSSHPQVQSSLNSLAVGKILLMETFERSKESEMPMAVLYDTSQDEDININSACLKALQDKTMNNPLRVDATYQDVCVTNVCSNGVIHCQLPSRGTMRLQKLLEEAEAILKSQMTSDLLVSRPFSGKFCLTRHKGKWSRAEITNLHGNRVMELLFIDLGVQATVEVTDLREIPPVLLRDFVIIPPQAIKCRLAELEICDDLSPEAVQWVKEAVGGSAECRMKILRLEEVKEDLLVHMYLFVDSDSLELSRSVNHQLIRSQLWQKVSKTNSRYSNSNNSKDSGLSDLLEGMTLGGPAPNPDTKASAKPPTAGDSSFPDRTAKPLPLPPPLELPKPGQSMDVFIPVACHPGYFVVQPWQDLHKLVVLMGEMILYYNQTWKSNTDVHIQKGEVYAAKIDKDWHRVQVKGILANGFVSVYELDYGKHELVRNNLLRPLIEEFRQLPFQAITAQLAGLTQTQWSEEASMLFRNHVEDRPLVAQVVSIQEASAELWQPSLTVYLVDTTLQERDLWIHSIMADLGGELSSAA